MGGFSLIKSRKGNAYISLICSDKGAGTALLRASEELGRFAGFTQLTLDAIGPAVGFYKKYGYIESDDACDRNAKISKVGEESDGWRHNKCLAKARKNYFRGQFSKVDKPDGIIAAVINVLTKAEALPTKQSGTKTSS